MTLAEQGAYVRLLCYQWQDGSIPDSEIAISRLISTTLFNSRKIWAKISECFIPCPDNPGFLINEKMEAVRSKQLAFKEERSKSGKKGAISKWIDNGSAIKEPMTKNGSSSSSSSSIKKRIPPAADNAAEHFKFKHDTFTAVPYIFRKPDFIKLAELRKAFGIPTKDTPPKWEVAVENYFRSRTVKHGIADLVSRYSVFSNSATDTYGKPLTVISQTHRVNNT